MKLHNTPEQAQWDRRIIEESAQHYVFDDVFTWSDMQRVVDVGAHIGAFTAWLKQVSPAAQIAAIEPDDDNYALLQHNVGSMSGVKLFHGAAVQGTAPLMVDRWHEPDNSGSHRLIPLVEGGTPYTGACFDLRSIMTLMGWNAIDALKLDCEGCEYGILYDGDLAVLRGCRVIVGEYHDGVSRFRHECIQRLAPWFDVVFLHTTSPLGMFCLVRKDGA